MRKENIKLTNDGCDRGEIEKISELKFKIGYKFKTQQGRGGLC